jgi:hypothetical protein
MHELVEKKCSVQATPYVGNFTLFYQYDLLPPALLLGEPRVQLILVAVTRSVAIITLPLLIQQLQQQTPEVTNAYTSYI